MMKLPRFLLSGLVTVLALPLLSACAPGEGVQEKLDAAHDRNDAPPIWVVKDHDSALYLFGTVHLLPTDANWQKDDMKAAFDEAGTVFFELDNSGQANLDIVILTQQLGLLSGGNQLSERLDPYQLKLLEAVSHNGDVPLAVLDTMKPWLASEMLTIIAAQAAGLSADLSPDETLKNRAARQKKNVLYLDSAETQIRASADLPDYVQMDLFIESMERFNSLGDELKSIALSWTRGDVNTLRSVGANSLKDKSPELYEALIVKRNKNWTQQFLKFLDDSGTGFAAIGMGHLLGDDSLQNMLRDQGYTVSRHYAFQGEPVIKASTLNSVNPDAEE